MEINKQKLNRQLAELAELEWKWNHNPYCRCGATDDDDSMRSWYSKDGILVTRFYNEQLDFTQSLDACFKWLVPRAIDKIMSEQGCSSDVAYAILFKKWLQELELIIPNAALALCLVIDEIA